MEGKSVRVVVAGAPETVQRIADAIEIVMPGFLFWRETAHAVSEDGRLIVEGIGASDGRPTSR